MQKFEFRRTKIEGLVEIVSFSASDIRGDFIKDYSKEIFRSNGLCHDLEEVFYTTSQKGVIRGLHFQREKQQPKLVRCICGHVWDVVVDLRRNSPTFKEWLSFDLTEENCREILVPKGCGHGFLVLNEHSVVAYKCGERFYGEYDDGIRWDDSDIAVAWPLELIGGRDKVILSEKDQRLQSFTKFTTSYGGL